MLFFYMVLTVAGWVWTLLALSALWLVLHWKDERHA